DVVTTAAVTSVATAQQSRPCSTPSGRSPPPASRPATQPPRKSDRTPDSVTQRPARQSSPAEPGGATRRPSATPTSDSSSSAPSLATPPPRTALHATLRAPPAGMAITWCLSSRLSTPPRGPLSWFSHHLPAIFMQQAFPALLAATLLR